MPNVHDAVPSSVRKPVESSRFVQNLVSRAQRPALKAAAPVRAGALNQRSFASLPQEPEDARLTGVTRSLQRRLLALNLPGELTREELFAGTKTA